MNTVHNIFIAVILTAGLLPTAYAALQVFAHIATRLVQVVMDRESAHVFSEFLIALGAGLAPMTDIRMAVRAPIVALSFIAAVMLRRYVH